MPCPSDQPISNGSLMSTYGTFAALEAVFVSAWKACCSCSGGAVLPADKLAVLQVDVVGRRNHASFREEPSHDQHRRHGGPRRRPPPRPPPRPRAVTYHAAPTARLRPAQRRAGQLASLIFC